MGRLRFGLGLLAGLGLAAACGSNSTSGNGTTGVQSLGTVSLYGGGPTPDFIEVLAGGQVTFVNRDSAPRQITSSDCPDVATARIEPGASAVLDVLNGPRSCTYGDALGATWQGHLSIVAHPRDGGTGGN